MAAILRLYTVLFVLVLVSSLLVNSADAQVVRNFQRHLGVLGGDGYHRAMPLTDPTWYNPYSPLNSTLIGVDPHAATMSTSTSTVPVHPGGWVEQPSVLPVRPSVRWHGWIRRRPLGH